MMTTRFVILTEFVVWLDILKKIKNDVTYYEVKIEILKNYKYLNIFRCFIINKCIYLTLYLFKLYDFVYYVFI